MELCRLVLLLFLVTRDDVVCEEQNSGVCNADSCEEKLENNYTQQVNNIPGLITSHTCSKSHQDIWHEFAFWLSGGKTEQHCYIFRALKFKKRTYVHFPDRYTMYKFENMHETMAPAHKTMALAHKRPHCNFSKRSVENFRSWVFTCWLWDLKRPIATKTTSNFRIMYYFYILFILVNNCIRLGSRLFRNKVQNFCDGFSKESKADWLYSWTQQTLLSHFLQPTSLDDDLTLQELKDRKLREVTEPVSDTIPRPIAWIDDVRGRGTSGCILLVPTAL